jgi:LmbE family N-acetylglucosaminyl deacetylase
MNYDLSLMTIGAHPDDEGGSSGVIAKYAQAGGRAYVVCATRGDGVDAKIVDPDICTREELGRVRVEELRCACEKLGAQPPIVLGYQDGEVEQVETEAAARTVAQLLRELRPTVVITHGPEGGYGHPDHIAVSRFTTRAVALAGDPKVDLGLQPFAPAKLYYTAFPRSFLEIVPAFRERRADIGGKQLGFIGVPDEQITTEVDIKPWMPVKAAALSCHRTQFEMDPETGRPKTFSRGLPEEDQMRLFGHERFVLARANGNLNARESDLFAGIGVVVEKSDQI